MDEEKDISEERDTGNDLPPFKPRQSDSDSIFSGIPLTNLKKKYEILSEVGSGASGVVYKAKQLPIGRLVAIKMLHSHLLTALVIKRFFREAKIISRFSHPNVISIFDFGISDEHKPFIVMDYVEGTALDEMILNTDPFPLDLTKSIVCQVCDGLSHAHAQGVVHRDLKPSNIKLVRLDSGLFLVKILDFGLAKILEGEEGNTDRITNDGETVGTPAYMSPEQVMGKELDQRSDLYSLGCVMYHCLAGMPPFVGETKMETMLKHLNEAPMSLNEPGEEPFLQPELEAIMMKALAKLPSDRFQSMSALKDAMIAIDQRITYAGSGLPLESLAEHRLMSMERKPAKALPMRVVVPSLAVAVLVLIVSVYLAVSVLMPDSKQPTEPPVVEQKSTSEIGGAPRSANQKKGFDPFMDQKFEATIEGNIEARSLSCEHQPINDVALTKIASMRNLQDLNLEHSAITNAGLKNLESLNVSVLNLAKSKINSDGALSLSRMPKLASLNISQTVFSDKGLEPIASIPTLKTLTLDETAITNEGCKYLLNAAALESLSLQNTKIDDTAIDTISKLKNLTRLNLSGTAITDLGVKQLASLQRLSNLKLAGTQVTSACIDDLARMPSLVVLSLSDNKLNDDAAGSLCKLEALHRLGVMRCGISRKAILQFQRKCPTCILEMEP